MAKLTVECHSRAFFRPGHKFLNRRTNHGPSRTTLAPSSLFRVGKILIYVNTDYHKLHSYQSEVKPKLIVTHSDMFSRAFRPLHVITSSFD